MTYQETLWKDSIVVVHSIKTARGIIHWNLVPLVGLIGLFVKEAKNGMLLVHLENGESRCVPATCCTKVPKISIF